MAVTLTISDGTDTVDFNDGTVLKLSSAFQMNVGAGSVNELVICGWMAGTSADTQSTTMRKTLKLLRKAQRGIRKRRIEDMVWLSWKPDDQTNTQYAQVSGGGFAEIGTYTIGGKATGVWTIDIIRNGDWWDTIPNGTQGAVLINGTTVYNKSDGDGDNWVSIAARDGDLPSYLEIEVDPTTVSVDAVTIATKLFDDATEADRFNPHFNVVDAAGVTLTPAETAAPGDSKADLSATDTATWTIADTDVGAYVGRYAAYAWIKQLTGDAGEITAAFASEHKTYDAVTVGSTEAPLYLGAVELPGTYIYPRLAVAASFTVSLIVTIGTATCTLYGMWLVPIDDDVFRAESASVAATNRRLVIDGAYKTTYVKYESDNEVDYTGRQVVAMGIYPRTEPGRYTRLYFYFERNSGGSFPGLYFHNDAHPVYIYAIDRYESLRGAT